jgi:hypothetical protein
MEGLLITTARDDLGLLTIEAALGASGAIVVAMYEA